MGFEQERVEPTGSTDQRPVLHDVKPHQSDVT